MSGRIIPTILEKGWRFPGAGPQPTLCSLLISLGIVMVPLGMSCNRVTVSVYWTTRSGWNWLVCGHDPFESNQFVLYPWAMSFFQRFCPDPFLPVSEWKIKTAAREEASQVASGKELACQCRRHSRFDSWVGKMPWRRVWQASPIFLPRESHGQRSLVGYSPQCCTESLLNHFWSTFECMPGSFRPGKAEGQSQRFIS